MGRDQLLDRSLQSRRPPTCGRSDPTAALSTGKFTPANTVWMYVGVRRCGPASTERRGATHQWARACGSWPMDPGARSRSTCCATLGYRCRTLPPHCTVRTRRRFRARSATGPAWRRTPGVRQTSRAPTKHPGSQTERRRRNGRADARARGRAARFAQGASARRNSAPHSDTAAFASSSTLPIVMKPWIWRSKQMCVARLPASLRRCEYISPSSRSGS